MKTTVFPTLEEALFLHEELIRQFGGRSGACDVGLLQSALSRPRSGFYPSLCEQAAALLQSLACNHCFVDGNKRLAFALTAVFFELNGQSLAAAPDEAEYFLVQEIIVNHIGIQDIAGRLERHLAPRRAKR